MFLELIHMPPLQKGQGLVGFFPFNNRNRLSSTVIFCWTSVFLINLRTKLEFFFRDHILAGSVSSIIFLETTA